MRDATREFEVTIREAGRRGHVASYGQFSSRLSFYNRTFQMATEAATPRRSKRFQPIIDAGLSSVSSNAISWLGDPVLIRQTRTDDVHEEDEFDVNEGGQTTFYSAFSRSQLVDKRKKIFEDFTYKVGDAVLVKTQTKQPSVGVIVALWEVVAGEDEDLGKNFKKVKVHWFLRPEELASVRARRAHEEVRCNSVHPNFLTDKLCPQNEIYFSLDGSAILTPGYIMQHCHVSSSLKGEHTEFCCCSAIDARRGLYFELDWEKHRNIALASEEFESDPFIIDTATEHKKQAGGRRVKKERIDDSEDDEASGDEFETEEDEDVSSSDDGGSDDDEEENALSSGLESDGDHEPRTPRKRKADSSLRTPSKRQRRTVAAPTPHSKAALRARAKRTKSMAIRPLTTNTAYNFMNVDTQNLPDDPWLRVTQVLHVGSRPDALPCRGEEYVQNIGCRGRTVG